MNNLNIVIIFYLIGTLIAYLMIWFVVYKVTYLDETIQNSEKDEYIKSRLRGSELLSTLSWFIIAFIVVKVLKVINK